MRTEVTNTLKRHATELLSEIERNITQHGLPSAYPVGVETFQRMTMLEGIARGEQAIAEGRVTTHTQVRTHLARWLK